MNQSSEKRSRSRTMKKCRGSIPAFLLKTYDMLENPMNTDIISWNEEGTAFIVKKVNEFSEHILPKQFKHNNFASFVRQLNMYDFHKTRHDNNDNEFKHKLFRRGHKNLLSQIKRKTNEQMGTLSLVKSEVMINGNEPDLVTQMGHLANKQSELEKLIKIIIKQNEKFQKENKFLWKELMKNKTKSDQQQEHIMMWFLQSLGLPKKGASSSAVNKQLLMLKEDDNAESRSIKNLFTTTDDTYMEQTLEGFSKQQLLQGLMRVFNASDKINKKPQAMKEEDEISVFSENDYEMPHKRVATDNQQQQLMLYSDQQQQVPRTDDNFIITDYPEFLSRKNSYFEHEFGQQPPQFFEE